MSDNGDTMDTDDSSVVKRFKVRLSNVSFCSQLSNSLAQYKSYNAELKDVHLPSVLSAHSKVDDELEVSLPIAFIHCSNHLLLLGHPIPFLRGLITLATAQSLSQLH